MPWRTLTAEMSYMDHQLQPEDLLHFVETWPLDTENC